MTRMFSFIKRTWNPVVGCYHACSYCWARRMAHRLRCPWCKIFEPHFHKERLRPFRPRQETTIFVVDMGDLWGAWVPDEWIEQVLAIAGRSSRKAMFFFETKNPIRYFEFIDDIPKSATLSTTIETDLSYVAKKFSSAPSPYERYVAIRNISWPVKHVSIEPVMRFSPELVDWLSEIDGLKAVSIGYDNYGHKLPEPPLESVQRLIEELQAIGLSVEVKTLRPAWWEARGLVSYPYRPGTPGGKTGERPDRAGSVCVCAHQEGWATHARWSCT